MEVCWIGLRLFTLSLFFQLDLTDFYDEDYDLDTDDDNQDSGDSDYANGDDSGNGET